MVPISSNQIDRVELLKKEPLRFFTCSNEQCAGHAAAAVGKTTGRPGLCVVTSGPGVRARAMDATWEERLSVLRTWCRSHGMVTDGRAAQRRIHH